MMDKLQYIPSGDYLIPALKLPEQDRQPLGRYGRLRKQYLQKHRPALWNSLLLSGNLYDHLRETDRAVGQTVEKTVADLAKKAGLTRQMKEENPRQWEKEMNRLRRQAEEQILPKILGG